MAGDVAGIQAQLASAARLALWARVEGLVPEDVERSLYTTRTLVKTWAMRGALHLLPARDLPLFLAGLRREGLLRERQWMGRYGLQEEDLAAMSEAVEASLASGPLTRKELAESVVDRLGARARPWVDHAWGGVVRLACLEGRACFGPARGRNVTFVCLEDWLPSWEEVPQDEAEEDLLRRYLTAFGPTTPRDYAAWSGMRTGAAREIWNRLQGELRAVGEEAWLLESDMEDLARGPPDGPVVRLLPHFDGYLLGHRDKGHLVAEAHYKRVYRKAGWISPTLLVDGRVAGVWSQEASGRRLRVEVEPFGPLPPEVRERAEAEARGLSRFLGTASSEVTFAPGNGGPSGASDS